VTEPILDIVVPIHDQAAWADLCIRAVEHHTRNPYRLILVDNASKEDGTKAVLRGARDRGHTLLSLPENRSFANAVNAGVAMGAGRYVAILNDDALVTEGWDGALLQDLADRDVGLVGARTNYASGPTGDPSWTGDAPWLVFVCVALRRQVWDAVGPLDEVTFDGFSSEDIDYCWRVVKAGLKLRVSARAYVLHAGSRTLGATVGDPAARAANDRKYNLRLLEKWGRDWVAAHTKLRESVLLVSFHYNEYCLVAFKDAWIGLKRSDGVTFSFESVTRAPIAYARMKAADAALDNGYDVLIMVDDDAEFPSDLVRRLLGHRKDVVTALAYQRKPPHLPCVFDDGDDGQLCAAPIMDAERTGLRRVGRSGLHIAAIRTAVVRRLREAGIRDYFGGFDNKVGEDFAFSLNCKKIGVPVYCDTDLIAPHLGGPLRVDEAYVKAYRAATAPPPGGPVPTLTDGVPLVVLR
jgi:GT2 family glycosyltransferase